MGSRWFQPPWLEVTVKSGSFNMLTRLVMLSSAESTLDGLSSLAGSGEVYSEPAIFIGVPHRTEPGAPNQRTKAPWTPMAEEAEDRREALDIFFEISSILKTGLSKESLNALVGLCELGVNPEALAEAVRDLRAQKEAAALEERRAPSAATPSRTGRER
ncbi:unnamed protein product [Cladocopium goreaui]|uniref:Mitotic-spindle organizing protein 1 n=1 Tax=Cladocopium goreaui TaxID=2562237 RepID=A0A9P1M204_9DINO|nr:unnamed protein product [Cladocopium goreaui]